MCPQVCPRCQPMEAGGKPTRCSPTWSFQQWRGTGSGPSPTGLQWTSCVWNGLLLLGCAAVSWPRAGYCTGYRAHLWRGSETRDEKPELFSNERPGPAEHADPRHAHSACSLGRLPPVHARLRVLLLQQEAVGSGGPSYFSLTCGNHRFMGSCVRHDTNLTQFWFTVKGTISNPRVCPVALKGLKRGTATLF